MKQTANGGATKWIDRQWIAQYREQTWNEFTWNSYEKGNIYIYTFTLALLSWCMMLWDWPYRGQKFEVFIFQILQEQILTDEIKELTKKVSTILYISITILSTLRMLNNFLFITKLFVNPKRECEKQTVDFLIKALLCLQITKNNVVE